MEIDGDFGRWRSDKYILRRNIICDLTPSGALGADLNANPILVASCRMRSSMTLIRQSSPPT
jgi:hypothetical protein